MTETASKITSACRLTGLRLTASESSNRAYPNNYKSPLKLHFLMQFRSKMPTPIIHKPAAEIFIISIENKCYRNINVDYWNSLAKIINVTCDINPPLRVTSKNTDSMIDIVKLFEGFNDEESAQFMKTGIINACEASPELFPPAVMLGALYKRDAKYIANPVPAATSGNALPTSSSNPSLSFNPPGINRPASKRVNLDAEDTAPAWFQSAWQQLTDNLKVVATKADLTEQISHTKMSLKLDITASEKNVMKKVTDAKKDLDSKITSMEARLTEIENGGGTSTGRGISNYAAANAYVNKGACYRKSVFANKRLGFINLVLTDATLWEEQEFANAETGEPETKYRVDSIKIRKALKVKFEIDEKTRFRVSKAGNLVFDIRIQSRNARLTFDDVAKIIDNRDKLEGITVSL